MLHARHIRLEALRNIIIQGYLEVIMHSSLVKLMQIRHNRFRVLCPKHHSPAPPERNVGRFPIEHILPNTIALSQTIEKPFRIKSRYIRRTTRRKNHRLHRFDTLPTVGNHRRLAICSTVSTCHLCNILTLNVSSLAPLYLW